MPKLLIIRSYVFLIYSADITENRNHIHVESRKGRRRVSAKYWLEPNIELVDSGNFSKAELKRIEKLIKDNYVLLVNQVEKFKKGLKVKTIKL